MRKSDRRGHFDYGWLNTYHTFSFAEYYDPYNMGFGPLRVINEDRIAPGQGFKTHPHRDMEILTYVLEGALLHRDSLGSSYILKAGEFQRMSAGSGVMHSEFNASKSEWVHILQIWILPNEHDLIPSYEERFFRPEEKKNRLCLITSPDGQENSLIIHQDAKIYNSILEEGKVLEYDLLHKDRGAWIQVLRGNLRLNKRPFGPGDGAAIEEMLLEFRAETETEFLLFDLG